MSNDIYTGREIAIFTDIHALLEPTLAVIDDIKKRGIKEIYSLGDEIGVGPNPRQVLEVLADNGVVSVAGNSEEYSVLGIDPFISYFNGLKIQSQLWTYKQLTKEQVDNLALYPHSIELLMGGKKICLCHFANDVRIDYGARSTWSYQRAIDNKMANPNEQFLYTNSLDQISEIEKFSKFEDRRAGGFVSAKKDPLLGGKTIDFFDEIMQGHVHFKLLVEDDYAKVRSLRALGMAYGKDPIDTASYVIVREKTHGYDVEEVLIPFRRDKMIESILSSDMPDKGTISKFVSLK